MILSGQKRSTTCRAKRRIKRIGISGPRYQRAGAWGSREGRWRGMVVLYCIPHTAGGKRYGLLTKDQGLMTIRCADGTKDTRSELFAECQAPGPSKVGRLANGLN